MHNPFFFLPVMKVEHDKNNITFLNGLKLFIYNPSLIQHYVIQFVSDLRQVGSFLWVLRFPPPIELTTTI